MTSPLKLLSQFEINFICSLQAKGEKVDIFGPGHMTKMATMPKYDKILNNILLQNHWADCLETLYEAFGKLVL